MQFFRKVVFSAPTSFLDLASLRHAVRLACFAAASPKGGTPAGAGAVVEVGAAGALGAAANPPAAGNRQRHSHAAAATVAKHMGISLMEGRIASPDSCTDEARMKLA
jgi:hypothetical protein